MFFDISGFFVVDIFAQIKINLYLCAAKPNEGMSAHQRRVLQTY